MTTISQVRGFEILDSRGNPTVVDDQIGTLTEALAAIDMADKAGYASIVSHRLGKTKNSVA